ncbi:zonular occludens toxin domain-containing protein [Ideonella sp.]|jgi:zona occludens toxin|uniref:zonular occludens toxin domain-containing protein n=1 Tax=Ideonella sp. TaxID=1929293 RepID=UPI0037C017FB
MPINVYTGLMRSGKSYEVVSQVILEAVAQGRRVVTNVDGIDNDLIRAYVAETRDLSIAELGQVVHCTNEEVFKTDFFPYYDDKKSAITETFCQPGDLVCIDEAWRFWGTDCKLLKEHKSFFLEHGHFVHQDSGVACDLVLMIQDMSTLHRFLRSVVAFSFRTHKKVSLGLGNTYSVNMWEGSKMTKATMIGTWVRKYDKAVFPLYSSFKGGVEGKTVNVDKRQNLLASKKLWFLAGCLVLFGALGVYGIKNFFSPRPARGTEGSKVALTGSPPTQDLPPHLGHQKPVAVSESWRISGSLTIGNKAFVVLVGEGGRVRLEHPSAFQDVGAVMVGDVDGERVTTWSGSTSRVALSESKQ